MGESLAFISRGCLMTKIYNLVALPGGGIYFGSAGRAVDEKGAYGYHTMQYYDWENVTGL